MKFSVLMVVCLSMATSFLQGQTVIPNAGFEDWTSFGSYSNPTGWDTPNEELMAIPFFGITVVSQSTDHHGTGSFSVKLETKHMVLPPLDVPGFITNGKLTIDINSGSFSLTGGVPVVDIPTHLKGFFKYFPKGGDSCAIGIGLTKTSGTIVDSIGLGSFSTKDTVADWTPFSAWIDYLSTTAPDTMNIIAISTAQETMTIGTTLYVDDLYLDYTVGFNRNDPAAGIDVYNDRETNRLMIFLEFEKPQETDIKLFNMVGQEIASSKTSIVEKGREIIDYSMLPAGVYLLQVKHDNQSFSKKFFLSRNYN